MILALHISYFLIKLNLSSFNVWMWFQTLDITLILTGLLVFILIAGLIFTLFTFKYVAKKHRVLLIAHEKTQAVLQRFDEIVKLSPSAVAVHDLDLRYLHVSNSYLEQFNVKEKHILGKHHYEVFPDLPQKWRDVHQRVLKGETLSADRDLFVREDGTEQYTRWTCTPWYNEAQEIGGLIVYTEVINQYIQAEKEIESSRQQLQLVMDHLPIGLAVNSVLPEVSFNYMNDLFPAIYGVEREALESGDFWRLVYPLKEDREKIKTQVLEDIESGDISRMYWEAVPLRKEHQKTRYITAFATPIPNTPLMISTVIDVTEQVEKEAQIRHANWHDSLTDLPNRLHYESVLAEHHCAEKHPLGLVMFDLNGLKLINDVYGSKGGDMALVTLADTLKNSLHKTEFLARIGGDEFALIILQTTHEEVQLRQRNLLEALNHLTYKDITLSVASGMAFKELVTEPVHEFIARAENHMLQTKTLDQRSSRNSAIRSIFNTLQQKYEEEKVHSERVSRYCQAMGVALGLDATALKELELAGLYHDIGKISIPDDILNKPGKLTAEEWEIMKSHTLIGYQILNTADQYSSLAQYALTHHERYDGHGYPNQLEGEDIPLFSRIIAVADSFEAMTSDRPYRKAMDVKDALIELKKHAGTQWDPKLISLFVDQVAPTIS